MTLVPGSCFLRDLHRPLKQGLRYSRFLCIFYLVSYHFEICDCEVRYPPWITHVAVLRF